MILALLFIMQTAGAQTFKLNADGYFNAGGTDVMAFSDFYPEGHQGGVCVIMNAKRVITEPWILAASASDYLLNEAKKELMKDFPKLD